MKTEVCTCDLCGRVVEHPNPLKINGRDYRLGRRDIHYSGSWTDADFCPTCAQELQVVIDAIQSTVKKK